MKAVREILWRSDQVLHLATDQPSIADIIVRYLETKALLGGLMCAVAATITSSSALVRLEVLRVSLQALLVRD